jgi:filamentous hemagglutinin
MLGWGFNGMHGLSESNSESNHWLGIRDGAKGLGSKVDDLLPNLNTRVLTETEARALDGENKSSIYVAEDPKGEPAAQEFQASANGPFTDLATGKGGMPALRFTNSDEKR